MSQRLPPAKPHAEAPPKADTTQEESEMRKSLEEMTGEELLLMSVLFGNAAHPAVKRELDRRAAYGTGPKRRVTVRADEATSAALRGGLLVA